MGTLIRYEFKKLLCRKVLWVTLALVLVLVGTGMKYRFVMLSDGHVQGMRDACATFEGQVLTDAVAGQARAALLRYAADHPDDFMYMEVEGGDQNQDALPTPKGFWDYAHGLWQVYSRLAEGQTAEQKQESIRLNKQRLNHGYFEDGRKLTERDRAELERSIEWDSHPTVVHYAAGWSELHFAVQSPGMYLFILLIVGLTALFSGEYSARMDNILLTTTARKQTILAKLAVSATFALALCVLFFGLETAAVALTYGLDGGQYPIRDLSGLYWDLTYGPQDSALPVASLYPPALALTALAAVACASIIALASSLFRHPLATLGAVAVALLVQFLPATISQFVSSMQHARPGEMGQLFLITSASYGISDANWPVTVLPAFQLYNLTNITSFADNGEALGLFAAVSVALGAACALAAPAVFCRRRKV